MNNKRYIVEDNSLPPFTGGICVIDTKPEIKDFDTDIVCTCQDLKYAELICYLLNVLN